MTLFRMFQRRGTAAQWQTANTVLAVGEVGFSYDNNVIKVGDGVTAWNSLASLDGKSAYEIAVDNGFVGTESAWLLSLAGDPGDISSKLDLSGGTLTGPLTLSGPPTSDLHAATKLYVDGLAAGINFHEPVDAATTENLAGTYNNGTNGFGATLTKESNGSIGTVDGVTVLAGNRILVRAQTDLKENGIYTITAVGSESAPWIITRATDADNSPSLELSTGDFCFVTFGSQNAGKGFVLSTIGTIDIGTTEIRYSQFSASEAVVAGAGISKSGETISVAGVTSAMLAAPTNNDSAKAIGYVGLPQVILNSGNLTLNATHAGKHVYVTGAGQTITIPSNSLVPFEIGTNVAVINGNVTSSIAIETDTLRLAGGSQAGTRSLAAYGIATLIKVNATTWIASGNGLT
jgi:hypothetical protein